MSCCGLWRRCRRHRCCRLLVDQLTHVAAQRCRLEHGHGEGAQVKELMTLADDVEASRPQSLGHVRRVEHEADNGGRELHRVECVRLVAKSLEMNAT